MTINLSLSFQHLPQPVNVWQTWYVAYSGGLDSTVLLHLLWQLGLPVHAVHVNHQLQPLADSWAELCAEQCRQWKIPYTLKKVTVQKNPGESPEAAARHVRYAAFKEIVTTNSVLCTAHHQDDQAETLLLQLLRGSGIAGMAAMPVCTSFNSGVLLRPLLNATRAELAQYAAQHQLKWIDDPTNAEDIFDRNYLRQHIMPLLKHRWPAAAQTIARSAEHCAEAEELLQEHTARDYQQVHEGHELLIDRLHELSPARQRQVIRFWLSEQQLPLPSTAQLQQIQTEVLASREDAEPLVHWSGVNIQRYRGRLYANKDQTKLDLTNVKLPWDLSQPLILPGNLGTLTAQLIEGEGISANRLAATPITIQFRRGGERCRPATRSHSQTLKNLFQEYAIPTWQRDQIPLLYCGDEIAAVLGQWICLNYSAKADEQGWVINWN